jgi:hypothetical protein
LINMVSIIPDTIKGLNVSADAMTVSAVPVRREDGSAYPEAEQQMHVTMQTLGLVLPVLAVCVLQPGAKGTAAEFCRKSKAAPGGCHHPPDPVPVVTGEQK